MRRPRYIRLSSSRKKGPCAASGACGRSWRRRGSSVLCILTGAPTTGTRRRRGARRQGLADAGVSRFAANRDHADSRLLARSAGPVGARLPYPARSAAQRAGAGRDHRDDGGQPVSRRAVSSWPITSALRCSAPEVGTAFIRGSARRSPRFSVCKTSAYVAKDNTVRYQGTSLQIPPRTPISSMM